MMERRAAGVVQHTNRITMEINTSTNILSSGLWRDLRRAVRDICLSRTGLRFRRDSDEVYKEINLVKIKNVTSSPECNFLLKLIEVMICLFVRKSNFHKIMWKIKI